MFASCVTLSLSRALGSLFWNAASKKWYSSFYWPLSSITYLCHNYYTGLFTTALLDGICRYSISQGFSSNYRRWCKAEGHLDCSLSLSPLKLPRELYHKLLNIIGALKAIERLRICFIHTFLFLSLQHKQMQTVIWQKYINYVKKESCTWEDGDDNNAFALRILSRK